MKKYCNFSSAAAKAIAGKDIILCIYGQDGEDLMAVAGQQDFTLNRSAASIDTGSKDTQGSWGSSIPGAKTWGVDSGGVYPLGDQSHAALAAAFENDDPVCVKIVDIKRQTGLWGGLAYITDYPIEAPYDDAATYSLTLSGVGPLVDLQANPEEPDVMPDGTAALGALTVVSVEGSSAGQTNIYVNPLLGGGNKYFYKVGTAPLDYPSYGEVISATAWNGSQAITATAGQQIMIIETDSAGKALKAGAAMVNVAD